MGVIIASPIMATKALPFKNAPLRILIVILNISPLLSVRIFYIETE